MAAVGTGDEVQATFAANRASSRIALEVVARDGRSRRSTVYEDGGLRVRFPNAERLEAVIVNTGGGIAGGDRLGIDITVDEAAALTVTSAAAEKCYRAMGEPATLDLALTVRAGATLQWLPQETILFNEASLVRRIEADIADTATVVLAESIVFGRTAMGEAVVRGSLFDRWRVRRSGRLIFAETTRLDGAIADTLGATAVGAGGCAIGTVWLAPADESRLTAARAVSYAGDVGLSAWNGFAVARLVVADGQVLRRDLALLLAAMQVPLPRLWLN